MGAIQQQLAAGVFSPANVAGLQAWYQPNSGTNPASVLDLSQAQGGGTLTAAATTPTVTTNGGVNVLRWDGSASKPLVGAKTFSFTHIFCVCCASQAGNFTGYPGLISGVTLPVLLGGDGTQSFFDLGNGMAYTKNGTNTPDFNAPRNNVLTVITAIWGSSLSMDGLQLGLDRNFAGRIWPGDIALLLFYNNASMAAGDATQIRKWCGAVCGNISTS